MSDSRGSQSNPENEQVQRYSADELAEYARSWFSVSPHVLAGALASQSAKTFTRDAAEKAVKAYAGKRPTPDNEGAEDEA
jgi:hypothetical protein